jgi:hypothetical protein
MTAAENNEMNRETIARLLEQQQRLQQFLPQAHQYIARVFLQDQENLQVPNNS